MILTIYGVSSMKIDMSRRAITSRLNTANQLRRTCLSLANSSAGRKIREKHKSNKRVQQTSKALGIDQRDA